MDPRVKPKGDDAFHVWARMQCRPRRANAGPVMLGSMMIARGASGGFYGIVGSSMSETGWLHAAGRSCLDIEIESHVGTASLNRARLTRDS